MAWRSGRSACIGTALGLLSGVWLERFADFMLLIGGILVPVGAVLLAHFVVLRREPRVDDLYREDGPFARHGGFVLPGVLAWCAGAVTYFLTGAIGATLPALLVSTGAYLLLATLASRHTGVGGGTGGTGGTPPS